MMLNLRVGLNFSTGRIGQGYSGVGGVVEDEGRDGAVEYEGMGRDKGRAGWFWWGWVGYGRLGWVFDFSLGGSFTFKRQIKYLSK